MMTMTTMTTMTKRISLKKFLSTESGRRAACAWIGVRHADTAMMHQAADTAARYAPLAQHRIWTLRELREAACVLDGRGVWIAREVAL